MESENCKSVCKKQSKSMISAFKNVNKKQHDETLKQPTISSQANQIPPNPLLMTVLNPFSAPRTIITSLI